MARKGKVGIDYFSHDVDMLNDRKVKLLKAKHGLIGYAVYLRLLEELYRDKGYYLEVSEDFNILFSDDNNLRYDEYILILNDCINQELFNKELFEKYSVLTSKRIQENYLTACERRKLVEIYKEYLILDLKDVSIKTDNVNILELNSHIGTQSKKKVKRNEKETEIEIEKTPFEKAVDDFKKHRKTIKAQMTDRAVELMIQKLDKIANNDQEKIMILNKSIEMGWKGIFPLNEIKNNQSNFNGTLKQLYDEYEGQ
jgi:hypothetical protein